MKTFLVYAIYDYYCQGWEETGGYFLVYARTFEEACRKIKEKLGPQANAREFDDGTIQ